MTQLDVVKIDQEWVKRREAALRAEEDQTLAAARHRATGAEREFLDALIALRARNAGDVQPN